MIRGIFSLQDCLTDSVCVRVENAHSCCAKSALRPHDQGGLPRSEFIGVDVESPTGHGQACISSVTLSRTHAANSKKETAGSMYPSPVSQFQCSAKIASRSHKVDPSPRRQLKREHRRTRAVRTSSAEP